ncbi:hypothetical protein EDM53_04725 [Rickettsiales endosymbiont of Peranema trichophorum]|uniref:hypothetical protein n=1 Tax=Rickettsiales endosymbiont of Peranema trichophorum TaxID=2486577 RepID=UPI0010236C00|nr:hypothetical protein [Rickettsiales endosymbiont of Peranema trichophorum]RZI45771.1 hypothetical protein EDM53_04725 [Rickettsiales endosymbiont of Peranema trichophorum]
MALNEKLEKVKECLAQVRKTADCENFLNRKGAEGAERVLDEYLRKVSGNRSWLEKDERLLEGKIKDLDAKRVEVKSIKDQLQKSKLDVENKEKSHKEKASERDAAKDSYDKMHKERADAEQELGSREFSESIQHNRAIEAAEKGTPWYEINDLDDLVRERDDVVNGNPRKSWKSCYCGDQRRAYTDNKLTEQLNKKIAAFELHKTYKLNTAAARDTLNEKESKLKNEKSIFDSKVNEFDAIKGELSKAEKSHVLLEGQLGSMNGDVKRLESEIAKLDTLKEEAEVYLMRTMLDQYIEEQEQYYNAINDALDADDYGDYQQDQHQVDEQH